MIGRCPVAMIACVLCALWPALARAQSWEPDQAQLVRVLARETVVVADLDPGGASGRARAAIWIAAPPAVVLAWMTDCARALTYVPNLKFCSVLQWSENGHPELVAHELDYAWFLPHLRYRFRTRYESLSRVQFQEESGDLEIHRGVWQLRAVPDAAHTLVTYEVRIRPRFYVPRWLVRRSLRKDLPELLLGLRAAAERAAAVPSP